MTSHARLSPSSAERWLTCGGSIRLIDTLDRGDSNESTYAQEGTRAHTLAEIEASYHFGLSTAEQHRAFKAGWLTSAQQHGDDIEEMQDCVRQYVDLLDDIKREQPGSTIRLELRLQPSVPQCWGTGDAVIASPDKISIIDFKYGRGVPVSVDNNPQLRLYGLGALEMFGGVLGDVGYVEMVICQPRLNNISRETLPVRKLLKWRDEVAIPAALEALSDDAPFHPSLEACRWCPAAGICKARSNIMLSRDFGSPDALSPDELADAWLKLAEIRDWCNAVEAEALSQAYSEGQRLPGLKVVLSGGRRVITDTDAAINLLAEAGYEPEQVSKSSLRTLADLEKLVGKGRLPEVLGDLLVRTPGKPALVLESDSRPAIDSISTARQEFSDETEE